MCPQSPHSLSVHLFSAYGAFSLAQEVILKKICEYMINKLGNIRRTYRFRRLLSVILSATFLVISAVY
jgi:hypothetical protein